VSGRLNDPLTVVTQDGSAWWRQAWDSAGHGLYARAESTERCPVLLTIRELAEFGLRGMSAPEPDGITQAIAPTQALQDWHDGPLARRYTTPHDLDLPQAGGQR